MKKKVILMAQGVLIVFLIFILLEYTDNLRDENYVLKNQIANMKEERSAKSNLYDDLEIVNDSLQMENEMLLKFLDDNLLLFEPQFDNDGVLCGKLMHRSYKTYQEALYGTPTMIRYGTPSQNIGFEFYIDLSDFCSEWEIYSVSDKCEDIAPVEKSKRDKYYYLNIENGKHIFHVKTKNPDSEFYFSLYR